MEQRALRTCIPDRPLPCPYYKRYIDDLFAIFTCPEHAHQFVQTFNAIHQRIQLEAVTVARTGIFLDLHLALTTRGTHDFLTHTLYQKPSNKYQCIPMLSAHRPHVFHAFISAELKRYRLACTRDEDFHAVVSLFRQRLVRRGYPSQMVTVALARTPSRTALLQPLLPLPPHVKPVEPTKHACPRKPIVILPLTHIWPTPHWRTVFQIPPELFLSDPYQAAYGDAQIVVGTRNAPNIGQFVTRSTFTSSSLKRKSPPGHHPPRAAPPAR